MLPPHSPPSDRLRSWLNYFFHQVRRLQRSRKADFIHSNFPVNLLPTCRRATERLLGPLQAKLKLAWHNWTWMFDGTNDLLGINCTISEIGKINLDHNWCRWKSQERASVISNWVFGKWKIVHSTNSFEKLDLLICSDTRNADSMKAIFIPFLRSQ